MKRILILASTGAFSRNFLRAGFLEEAARSGLPLEFVAPKEKIAAYHAEFGVPHEQFAELPPQDFVFAETLFRNIEKWSVHTRFMFLHHMFFLRRRGSQDPFPIRVIIFAVRMLLWFLGQFHFFRVFVRLAYTALPAPSVHEFLKTHKPTLVFCPSVLYGTEWQFIKEAKKLGIKTIGMLASWDNFYSKTFLRAFPDYLLVQNELLKRQAMRLADYPEKRIRVVGTPQYDCHVARNRVIGRNEFFQNIGADPAKKLILYAFSGKISEAVDNEMLAVLQRTLTESGLAQETQVLIRPYPKRNFSPRKAQWARKSFGFLVDESSTEIGAEKDKWEMDERALGVMANSLAHADVVITTCSTFFLEAAIFGTPLVGISFDGGLKLDKWNSTRRFREWEHIADLERTGGVWFVEREAELVRALRSYLSSRALHAEGRGRIIDEQLAGFGGKAAWAVAHSLKNILNAV